MTSLFVYITGWRKLPPNSGIIDITHPIRARVTTEKNLFGEIVLDVPELGGQWGAGWFTFLKKSTTTN